MHVKWCHRSNGMMCSVTNCLIESGTLSALIFTASQLIRRMISLVGFRSQNCQQYTKLKLIGHHELVFIGKRTLRSRSLCPSFGCLWSRTSIWIILLKMGSSQLVQPETDHSLGMVLRIDPITF